LLSEIAGALHMNGTIHLRWAFAAIVLGLDFDIETAATTRFSSAEGCGP
jgi:hypothetical protein